MSVLERDVALQGKDPATGQSTIDFPFSRMGNIETDAEIHDQASGSDYIPIAREGDIYFHKILVNDLFKSKEISTITGVIPASPNSDRALNISDEAFVKSGYVYIVSPDAEQAKRYAAAQAQALNLTQDGQMPFTVKNPITADITVRILKIGVSSGTGEVFNITGMSESSSSVSVSTKKVDITIPKDGWEDSAIPSYPFTITIPVADITADSIPEVTLKVGENSKAYQCGLSPVVESLDGSIRLWTLIKPTSDIQAVCSFIS